jgi:hypothetical protein
MELTATLARAMLPGGRVPGQDRWAATGSAVVVLDGATAVDPAVPPADAYATDLCAELTTSLAEGSDPRRALRDAISTVDRQLGLTPGRGPRNRPGGCWIADADPAAADPAIVHRYAAEQIEWCVLATDGAQRPFDHRHGAWSALPADAGQLHRCLEQLHEWEENSDPDGRLLPRSKRHDDKTLVVWRL